MMRCPIRIIVHLLMITFGQTLEEVAVCTIRMTMCLYANTPTTVIPAKAGISFSGWFDVSEATYLWSNVGTEWKKYSDASHDEMPDHDHCAFIDDHVRA